MEFLSVPFVILCQIIIVRGTWIPKIIDGFTCSAADYPYLISLSTISHGFFCGGSLLNSFYVLTAAHCCDYTEVSEQIKVYAGISEKRDYLQTSKVWERFMHSTLDVCVLRLYTPIRETFYTKFTKLATTAVFTALMENNQCENCITLGFGRRSIIRFSIIWKYGRSSFEKLQCVHQKVLNQCTQGYGILCVVGSDRPTQDACLGDSGGPLICKGVQVGIVSSGRGCGLGHPSYYVQVDKVYDFVMETSQANHAGGNWENVVLLKTRKGTMFCSGTLLLEHLTLTAGVCCRYLKFKQQIEIYAGLINGTTKQKAVAKKRFVHPTVSACILQLEKSIKLNANIKLTRIATPDELTLIMERRGCDRAVSIGYVRNTNLEIYYINVCPVQLNECDNDGDVFCYTKRKCSHHNGGPIMCENYQVGIVVLDGAIQRAGTKSNISSKIVGGFTCHPTNYPYLVSLKTHKGHIFCGGSLLNSGYALTAGHCCEYIINRNAVVYAGLSIKKGIVQTAVADLRIFHPTIDVCVIKLKNSLRETSYTKFVKIADTKLFDEIMGTGGGRECITLGFGFQAKIYANLSKENVTQSKFLQCVYQDMLGEEYCGDTEILCAVGSHNSMQDACVGDSGGPLLCRGVQVGLVLAGIGCGLGLPSFYLRIPSVHTFIMAHSISVVHHLQMTVLVSEIVYFLI
ncbi:hypothetical protein Trydic_g16838 [Trypoxylus dichotomus]